MTLRISFLLCLLCLLLASSLIPSARALPAACETEVCHNTTLLPRADGPEPSSSARALQLRTVFLSIERDTSHYIQLPGTPDPDGRIYSAKAAVMFGATIDEPPIGVQIDALEGEEGQPLHGMRVREFSPGPGADWAPNDGPLPRPREHIVRDLLRLPRRTGLTNTQVFHGAASVWREYPVIRLGPGVINHSGIDFVEDILRHRFVFNRRGDPVDPGIPAIWQQHLGAARKYLEVTVPAGYVREARTLLFQSAEGNVWLQV